MSEANALAFLRKASEDPDLLARYNGRNLTQLLFHARHDGFEFTAEDLGAVVGRLEFGVIVDKDGDPMDESSRLWREMWGRPHLEYLVKAVVRRFGAAELTASLGVEAAS